MGVRTEESESQAFVEPQDRQEKLRAGAVQELNQILLGHSRIVEV